jgi:hypothetical protein
VGSPELDTALRILSLAAALEPPVLNFITTLMQNAQGKTADDFLAEADDIWDSIIKNAQKELGSGN